MRAYAGLCKVQFTLHAGRLMALVSVIVPCYNSAAFLSETIESLQQQTYSNIELILVDDGSVDSTAELIAACKANPGRLKVHACYQENQGVAAARNLGISIANAEFIVPLDADDLLHADFIALAMLAIAAVDIVYPDRQEFGQFERTCSAGVFSLERLKYFNQLNYCALYRRSLWCEYHYDPRVSGFDDWDFWLAAARHGARAHHLSRPMLQHRRHASSQIAGIRARYGALYARIVLNHAEIYTEAEQARAHAVLRGDADYRSEQWLFERSYF
jgi:glycosyltransferase involved in cell wall biosynthesis